MATDFVGCSKVDLPYEELAVAFKTEEGRTKIAVYCAADCHLVRGWENLAVPQNPLPFTWHVLA